MSFRHGVSVGESATSVSSPLEATAGLPIVFGTAPVNLSQAEEVPVNKPVLAYSFAEAVAAMGYSDDWEKFTLCEFMDSHFRQFGLSPVVLINVLDPAIHKTIVPASVVNLVDRQAILNVEGILINSIVIKSEDGETTYIKDADYAVGFNNKGYVIISAKSTIPTNATKLSIEYTKLDAAAVDKDDIIGGVEVDGSLTGLELIQQVFPKFGMVPGLILAPGYSEDPEVASVMTAKAGNINSVFKALALTDLPTDSVHQYADVPQWKNQNNYTSLRQVPAWPMVKLGEKRYHFSTQLAGVIGATDAANNGVPYASPSNKLLKANGLELKDGTEVFLGIDQANYLNSQGVVTGLNFLGGLKAWGNYTGAYPSVTDPKDSFIPIRRMFDWIGNSIVLTYWQKVDDPMNKRLTDSIVDSINIWINGLTAGGYLLGGRVEFRDEDNTTASLMAGKVSFRLFITPPSPAQEISVTLEYDVQYLTTLLA